MSAENIHLTSSEWHVMEFLWDHTPCTGREATSCLEKTMGWSRSTTLTLLRRLESKGAVASDTDHGKKSFRPLVKRDAAVLHETKHFLAPRLPWKPKPHGLLAHPKTGPAPGRN